MKADQWVYTTSCWNRALRSGWGTFSCSPGVEGREIRELEDFCAAPDSTKPEEFPLFKSLVLSTGRKAIVQSFYIEKTFYDLRPRVSITHALIIGAQEQWPRLVTAYACSPVFWRELPDALKTEALAYRDGKRDRSVPPPPLPQLEVESIPPGNPCSAQYLQARLAKDSDFAGKVGSLLQEFLERRVGRVPLILRCEAGEWVDYFGALACLAPCEMAEGSVSNYLPPNGDRNVTLAVGNKAGCLTLPAPVEVSRSCRDMVRIAQHELDGWREFSLSYGPFPKERLQPALDVFRLTCGDLELTPDLLGRICPLLRQSAFLPLLLSIAEAVLAPEAPKLSVPLFTSFVHTLMGALSGPAVSEQQVDPRHVEAALHSITHQVAALLMDGSLEVAAAAELLKGYKSCKDLWMSERFLLPYVESKATDAGLCRILEVCSALVDGRVSELLRNQAVRRAVERLSSSDEGWSLFIKHSPSKEEWWMAQHAICPQNDGTVNSRMAEILSGVQDAKDIAATFKYLLQHGYKDGAGQVSAACLEGSRAEDICLVLESGIVSELVQTEAVRDFLERVSGSGEDWSRFIMPSPCKEVWWKAQHDICPQNDGTVNQSMADILSSMPEAKAITDMLEYLLQHDYEDGVVQVCAWCLQGPGAIYISSVLLPHELLRPCLLDAAYAVLAEHLSAESEKDRKLRMEIGMALIQSVNYEIHFFIMTSEWAWVVRDVSYLYTRYMDQMLDYDYTQWLDAVITALLCSQNVRKTVYDAVSGAVLPGLEKMEYTEFEEFKMKIRRFLDRIDSFPEQQQRWEDVFNACGPKRRPLLGWLFGGKKK